MKTFLRYLVPVLLLAGAAIALLAGSRLERRLATADRALATLDLAGAAAYAPVAARLMFDAKPPADDASALPGGNGRAFDWRLMSGRTWPKPWLLSGGLTPENVAEAVAVSGAREIDVSSGVESAPGVKDPALIDAFFAALA